MIDQSGGRGKGIVGSDGWFVLGDVEDVVLGGEGDGDASVSGHGGDTDGVLAQQEILPG